MSDMDENDVDETTDETSAPKALRAQNSKLNKQLEELQKEFNTLKQRERSATIADVLRDKQANPKLAKHIARDLEGEVTPEAVTKWLEEEGDVFGYKPADPDPDESDETVNAQQAISAATAGAPAAPSGWTLDRLKTATTQQLIEANLLEPKY